MANFKRGDVVRHKRTGEAGTVAERWENEYRVAVQGGSMWAQPADLELVTPKAPRGATVEGRTVKANMTTEEAERIAEELAAYDRLRAQVDELRSYLALPKFAGCGNDYVNTADVALRLGWR